MTDLVLEEIPGVIRIAPMLLLIDIFEGLSGLPKLASVFEKNEVLCIALLFDTSNHSIQISALTNSEDTKSKVKELKEKINKDLSQ